MEPFFDYEEALAGIVSEQVLGKGPRLRVEVSAPEAVGSFSSEAESISCLGSASSFSASPLSGPWSTGPSTPSEPPSAYVPYFGFNQGALLTPEDTQQYYPPPSPSPSIYEASENEDGYSLLHPTVVTDANSGIATSGLGSTADTSLNLPRSRHQRLDLREEAGPLLSLLIRSVQGGFQCDLPNCANPGETFPTEEAVIIHIRTQDAATETGRFACTCKKRFVSKDIATRHVRTQNCGKIFKCPVDTCSHRFKREDQIGAHVRAKHPGHPFQTRKRRRRSEGCEVGGSLIPLSPA